MNLALALIQVGLICVSTALFAADDNDCFNGGRIVHLNSGGSGHDVNFSKDKSFAIVGNYEQDSFKVIDLKTNHIKEFPKPAGTSAIALPGGEVAFTKFDGADMSSAEKIFEAAKKAKTIIFHPKTGQKREVVGKFVMGESLYGPVTTEGKNTIVVRSEAGQERRIELNIQGSDTVLRWSDDESEPEVSYSKKESTIWIKQGDRVLFNGKLKYSKPDYIPGGFSPNKNLFVTSIEDAPSGNGEARRKLVVIDLAKKNLRTFEMPAKYSGGNFSPDAGDSKFSRDSRKLLLDSHSIPNDGVKMIDLGTGSISTVSKIYTFSPKFNESGNICVENQGLEGKNAIECINPTNGSTVSKIEIPLGSGSVRILSPTDFIVSVWGFGNQESQVYYVSDRRLCPKIITPVECNCTIPLGQEPSRNIEVVKDLAIATACAKKFDERDWKNLPSANLNSIDEKSSIVLLKRFSKPGGFKADEHAGLIVGMIKAGIHQKYPAEFKAAMGGVVYSSDRFYDSLLSKYPEIAKLPNRSDPSCQTSGEKTEIEAAIQNYTKARILSLRRPKFSELEALVSLAKDTLPEDKRGSLAELAADQLVFSSGDSAELNQIFPSKIYKFSENKMKSALGLKYKDLTDMTVVRSANNLVFYQLGVSPFEGSKETLAGFHINEIKRASVAALPEAESTERFNWKYGGLEYSAEIGINKQKLERPIVAQGEAPNYSEMWKGKTFRGVIIAGSNLGPGLTASVMKEYIEYYTQQGFSFGEPSSNEDIPRYLEGRVSGPEPMHYFVKEAHSDGDEKNLFRVSKQGKILRGQRKIGDKAETIDLIYPSGDVKSILLSNQEFGKWVREREKNSKPQLIYFNSSCWSKSKAIYEISAAATPTLINIPTTTSMVTFSNSDKNVMRAAIDGVRKQKTYGAIREDMKKDSKYELKNANVFIFPDEEEYRKQVTDVLRTPVDVNPRLFLKSDGSLVPYSIEETH